MGVEDKTDMSSDYDKFDEIPPLTVKTDPSITLNNEDSPWLQPKKAIIGKGSTYTKKDS